MKGWPRACRRVAAWSRGAVLAHSAWLLPLRSPAWNYWPAKLFEKRNSLQAAMAEADPVEELKARIEEIKAESESKLQEAAEQSAAELKKLQESWCACHHFGCWRVPQRH